MAGKVAIGSTSNNNILRFYKIKQTCVRAYSLYEHHDQKELIATPPSFIYSLSENKDNTPYHKPIFLLVTYKLQNSISSVFQVDLRHAELFFNFILLFPFHSFW
ncbi:hypothetical protein A9P82_02355 [Arachidicoccus ginsenosidimutans]|nr:hypothetical protein A9P82_02355 [Arachidicoccus sp. BS20]